MAADQKPLTLPGKRPVSITVATYNIHQWVGCDGSLDIDRTLAVIRSLEADLIALQEVLLPIRGFTVKSLAHETGMEALPGRTMWRGDSEYGNVLLSSLPVGPVCSLDITVGRYEPRGVVVASPEAGASRVSVFATHLGLRLRERVQQMERLASELEITQGVKILLADVNEWNPMSPVFGTMRRIFGRQRAPRSFPSRSPMLALDRILASPPVFTTFPRALKNPTTVKASDHLPVLARVMV